ncbi:MAG: MCE family protein, partial [Pseudomonadota bacterium]
ATLASADAAANAITDVAGETQALIAAVRPPATRFAETGLYEATQLTADMRLLVGTLNRLADRLERDPGAFLFGDGQGGFEVR